MEDSKYDNEVFCMKCFQSAYNFTRGKSSAKKYDLLTLLDIPDVDSCDPESFEGVDIKEKVSAMIIGIVISISFLNFRPHHRQAG